MPKRTNIYLPEDQLKKLKNISTIIDLSVSEIVRRSIEEYLTKEEKKTKKR